MRTRKEIENLMIEKLEGKSATEVNILQNSLIVGILLDVRDLLDNNLPKISARCSHNYIPYQIQGSWSASVPPPCPTHSRMNFLLKEKGTEMRFPNMKLYEEILFLKHFFKGKYVVENVRSYYEPLIKPQEIQSHYFWSNFEITDTGRSREKVRNDKGQTLAVKMVQQGFDIKDFHGYKKDKRTLLNNCIEPELGLHILKESMKETPKLF